jgi:hypothetical protein
VLQNKENQHFKLSYKGKMVTRKGDQASSVTLFKIREPENPSYANAIEVPKVGILRLFLAYFQGLQFVMFEKYFRVAN